MREILFRGKRLDNGEWVSGRNIFEMKDNRVFITPTGVPVPMLCCDSSDVVAMMPKVEVDPETVGQYTGLTDKNGKKIFDGDILMFGFSACVVKWDTPNARYMLYENGVYLKNGFNIDSVEMKEVIGNIHDNPELLGGE